MAFKDLLVPKWKHSRVEVRLDAFDSVRDDLAIVREIAETDSSPQVRKMAIQNIDDELLLEMLLKSEKDVEVLEALQQQRELLLKKTITTSNDPQAVVEALKKYDNEKVIADYLCEHNVELSAQRALISHLKSPKLLAKITEHECALEIAETIVEQITEKELLERIARRASNKKIRSVAHEKLDTLFTDPLAGQHKITKKLQQCCNGLDIQVSPYKRDEAVATLDISRKIWDTYDPQRTHPLVATYLAAEKLLLERVEHVSQQCAVLDTLETVCRGVEQLSDESSDTLSERFDELQQQWVRADRVIIEGILTVSLNDRFTTACKIIQKKIDALKEKQRQQDRHQEALEKACAELEHFAQRSSFSDKKTWQQLCTYWEALCKKSTPGDLLKNRFVEIQNMYAQKCEEKVQQQRSAQQHEIESVERIVAEMKSIAQASPLKIQSLHEKVIRLKKQWNNTGHVARECKAALELQFTHAYEQFMDTYQELQEQSSWQQWASENKKVTILEEFEQFKNRLHQDGVFHKIARQVSLFESRWRQAGGSSRSEKTLEQDERFFTLRDQIFTDALAKKGELLEVLKKIQEAPTSPGQTEEVKALQREWSSIGYLPPELEGELPDTFYELCNTFFEQQKESYQKYTEECVKNSTIREEICRDAEALATSSDWKTGRESFVQLQKRWDESWPSPYKLSQQLWQRFSVARDNFFERYHVFQQENDKRKEELCEKAESLYSRSCDLDAHIKETHAKDDEQEQSESPQIHIGKILSEAVGLQKVWKESGPASRERSDELWERFNNTIKKVFVIIDEEHKKNFDLKEALVKEAESLASSVEWDEVSQRFVALREEWKKIKPAARRDEQELWKRFQGAGDTFFSRRKAHFDIHKSTVHQKIDEKENLIAEMEILVRIAGKSHLLRTSENQSAAEILKKGMELSNRLVVDGDPEKTYNNIKKRALEIIDIWENGEQLQGRSFYLLDKRFDELLSILKR